MSANDWSDSDYEMSDEAAALCRVQHFAEAILDGRYPDCKLQECHYAAILKRRGLAREFIDTQPIFYVHGWFNVGRCLNNEHAARHCGSAIGIAHLFRGRVEYLTLDLDKPRRTAKGKLIKREGPKRVPKRHFFPSGFWERLEDPSTKFVVAVESTWDALLLFQLGYCVFAICGITSWSKPGRTGVLQHDQQRLIKRMKEVGVTTMILLPDSDISTNYETVKTQTGNWAKAVRKEKLVVGVGVIPDGANDPDDPDGEKIGPADLVLRTDDGKERLKEVIAKALNEPTELPIVTEKQWLDHAKDILDDPKTPVVTFGYRDCWWQHTPSLNRWTYLKAKTLECIVRDYLNDRYSHVTTIAVREVVAQLESLCHIAKKIDIPLEDIELPIWIVPYDERSPDWRDKDFDYVFVAGNGFVDMPRVPNGTHDFHPPTSQILNVCSADGHWNPVAPANDWYLKYARNAWSDEGQRKRADEICSIILIRANPFHSIITVNGPSGSGKTTFTGIIQDILGKKNCAACSTKGLPGRFGLQNLVDKLVGICGEARLSRSVDEIEFLSTILAVSGRERMYVDIKGKEPIEMRLNSKLLFTSNALMGLHDPNCNLKRRIVDLSFEHVVAHVDPYFDEKLRQNLSGILNEWIAGYDRLMRQGHFTEIKREAGEVSAVDLMLDAGAPLRVFFRDRCEFGRDFEDSVDSVYTALEGEYLKSSRPIPSKEQFKKQVAEDFPGQIKIIKSRDGGTRIWKLRGVRLLPPDKPREESQGEVEAQSPTFSGY